MNAARMPRGPWLVVVITCLAAPVHASAQDRVGIAIAGDATATTELEASMRAACAARGLALVPADEMRAAIHFTAPTGTLTDAQAQSIVAQLHLRGLFAVAVEAGPTGALLLQVRLVRTAGVATRFGEVSHDALPEWIAALISGAVGAPPDEVRAPAPSVDAAPPTASVAPPSEPIHSATPTVTPVIRASEPATQSAQIMPIIAEPTAPPSESSTPRVGIMWSLSNRGSARICRAEARRGSNVIEENVLEAPIEPREDNAEIVSPESAETVVLYTCSGQQLASLTVAHGETRSIDYIEVGHFPIYLRFAGGVYGFDTLLTASSTHVISLVPTASVSFAYMIDPNGWGIGAIARFGADVSCFNGTCDTGFGGLYVAGLATPSGVFGLGALILGPSSAFAIASEIEMARFTNDFYLSGGYNVAVGGAGAGVALSYGVFLGLGGSIL